MTGYVDVAVLCGLQSTEHTFVRAGAETYQCENERLGEKISSKMHAYLYLYTVLQYKCVKLETNTHTDINIYILMYIYFAHNDCYDGRYLELFKKLFSAMALG